MNRTPTAMTVGRQLAVTLALSLAVTLAITGVGLLALQRVGDAKDRVIDRESVLVVEAHRLDLAVAERGVAVRNLLITADEQYRSRIEVADALYRRALDVLDDTVYSGTGRTMLDEIVQRKEELDAVTATVVEQRLDGTLAAEALPEVIEDRIAPLREDVSQVIDDFVDHEQQAIRQAVESSDDTVDRAISALLALAVIGLVLAVGIGGWISRHVRRRLTGLALDVDSAATEILAGTAQQAAAASQQAAAVQETLATADELAQTAQQSAERARTVADAAQRSSEVAHDGTSAVGESATVMAEIREQVGVIASTVVSLAERAQDISGIIRTVDHLAEQIHLLALNAAIEAARAGAHGRGFSVVASEVRSLADQSRRATSQIAEILGEIQNGTNTAVMATEQGDKSAAEGVQRIQRTGSTIEQLAETVASSAIAAEQISASSGQQAVATSQISHAMRDLDETTQQSAAAARQAEQAAKDLNNVTAALNALVGVR